jgi:hypothetical protein
MIIQDLDYLQISDYGINGGAFAFSTATALNGLGFAFAANDSTAGIFVANSNSLGVAAGIGNFASASGFSVSTI